MTRSCREYVNLRAGRALVLQGQSADTVGLRLIRNYSTNLFREDNMTKLLAALIASVFATCAFAQDKMKSEMKDAAKAPAAAPMKDAAKAPTAAPMKDATAPMKDAAKAPAAAPMKDAAPAKKAATDAKPMAADGKKAMKDAKPTDAMKTDAMKTEVKKP